jgi:hypothetical protein
MTGTPLDLTPFGSVFNAVGSLYWLIFGAVMLWVLRRKKSWRHRVGDALIVLLLFGILPGYEGWKDYQAPKRLRTAEARFQERCKPAGEKINRTVDNVEGVLLLNVRPKADAGKYADPNWPDAALPHEHRGEGYIRTFLFWEHHEDKRSVRGFLNEVPSDLPGYRFVDVKEDDGSVSRYRLAPGSQTGELTRDKVTHGIARYAISFVNFAEPEDRARWIAGTKVLVTDTSTGEVIGESTWYSMDRGQGSRAGFRDPWGSAKTCPPLNSWVGGTTRFFVDKVLKPTKGG